MLASKNLLGAVEQSSGQVGDFESKLSMDIFFQNFYAYITHWSKAGLSDIRIAKQLLLEGMFMMVGHFS